MQPKPWMNLHPAFFKIFQISCTDRANDKTHRQVHPNWIFFHPKILFFHVWTFRTYDLSHNPEDFADVIRGWGFLFSYFNVFEMLASLNKIFFDTAISGYLVFSPKVLFPRLNHLITALFALFNSFGGRLRDFFIPYFSCNSRKFNITPGDLFKSSAITLSKNSRITKSHNFSFLKLAKALLWSHYLRTHFAVMF